MMIFASACSPSFDPGPVAVRPVLPALPVEMVQECEEPGVDRDAIVALTENRVALADCRRRHNAVVDFYHDLQADLSNVPSESPG